MMALAWDLRKELLFSVFFLIQGSYSLMTILLIAFFRIFQWGLPIFIHLITDLIHDGISDEVGGFPLEPVDVVNVNRAANSLVEFIHKFLMLEKPKSCWRVLAEMTAGIAVLC